MNKIVRSKSVTPCRVKSSNVPVKLVIVASRVGSSVCMTEYLITARAAIILWTNVAVIPAEIVFHAIEAELECRGVEL